MTHLNPHLIQIGLFDLGMVITIMLLPPVSGSIGQLYIVYIT